MNISLFLPFPFIIRFVNEYRFSETTILRETYFSSFTLYQDLSLSGTKLFVQNRSFRCLCWYYRYPFQSGFDYFFRSYTEFSSSQIIQVSTIIFAKMLFFTLAGVIFFSEQFIKKRKNRLYQHIRSDCYIQPEPGFTCSTIR